jgi:hypothetical protein
MATPKESKKRRLWAAVNRVLDDPHTRFRFKRLWRNDAGYCLDDGTILVDPRKMESFVYLLHELSHGRALAESDEDWTSVQDCNSEYDEEEAEAEGVFLFRHLTPRQYTTLFCKIAAALRR